MNLQTFLGLCITALAMAGCAAPPPGATQAMQDGLVAVDSRNLDRLYLRPEANLPGYRRVMIDPVRVDVRTQMHAYNRIQSPAVYPDDVARFVEETAAGLDDIIAEAFKARGYEVAAAPEPGVRSEEHTSELQSHLNLVCRLLLEKKKKNLFTSQLDNTKTTTEKDK